MEKKRNLCGVVIAGDGELFKTGEVIAPSIEEKEATPEQETISEMENIEARR